MIKPKRLQRGDVVAVVSPSWGGPGTFADVYQNGVNYLEQRLGLRVKEYKSTRMHARDVYNNPQLRAQDINDAFGDPEVKAIISSIGGDDSIRILPYLDMDSIGKNPKLIMGYSDTTTILCYLNLHGLVTFYGNSVMAGFSYLHNFPDAAREYEEVLFGHGAYKLEPFAGWTDKYKPWGDKANVGQVDTINHHDLGHRWINKGVTTVGPLWGGCMEVLVMMNGTLAWPPADFWKGRVLMLETSEEKPSPQEVGYALRNFGMQGILGKIAGLLVAKPKDYSVEEKADLDREILRIAIGEFGCKGLNIVTNVEFGHTDPRHMMPLGIKLELDPGRETLIFTEDLFA